MPSLILLGHEDEDEDKSIQMVKSYSKKNISKMVKLSRGQKWYAEERY